MLRKSRLISMIREEVIDEYRYRVIFVNRDIVSYIEVEETMDEVNITDVFTKEDYRRKGYSKKLFGYLFDKYRDKRFMLEVRSRNKAAISLYESLGFSVIYKRLKYYKDDDAYIMERK